MAVGESNNKRMVKNTLLLYVRMFLTIAIQLYTVPIVLKALGVDDYGLYSVIGGITALFGFISSSMASGAQRFFSYAIGTNNYNELKRTFDTTVTIYLTIAICVFVLFELVGVWYVNNVLVFQAGRTFAANVVFQLSIIAFILKLLSVPYNAVVIAHEHMGIYAYLSIGTAVLTFIAVSILKYFNTDYLILYASFVCAITLIERILYGIYCSVKFRECRSVRWRFDSAIGKKILGYSGYNMIGSIAYIFRNQGLSILINLFFGTVVNAAHAIANQICQVANAFISNLYMATRPQITKLYAADKVNEMWALVYHSRLLAFYLLTLIAVPLIIEMPYILQLWLGNVPAYTIQIADAFIFTLLIETTVNQVISVFQSYNKIREYQLLSSTILLVTLPVAYIVLKMISSNVLIAYYIQIIFSVMYVVSILLVAHRVVALNIRTYVTRVVIKDVVIFVLALGLTWFSVHSIAPSFVRLVITTIISSVLTILFVYAFGLDKNTKTLVKNRIHRYRNINLKS
jgi:O-antigen/teichoic acid export membrane protein